MQWVHRYYLKNLCDTDRFPGWPLVDHVPFLQALLDAWRGGVFYALVLMPA